MKLYGSAPSPYVMRVAIAARAKGADLAPEEFAGGAKSNAFLTFSPIGKIPLFVDGDLALPESKVIVDYLDTVLPGAPLVPADPRAAARVRLLERIVDVYVDPEIGTLFRSRADPAAVSAAIGRLTTALRYLDHFRGDAVPWLAGEAFTVADAALMPIAFFFGALGHADAVLGGAPRIAEWWRHASASELGAWLLAEQTAGMKTLMARLAA